jgi:TRAP-type C4-dicarboxylate transport system permease small subunit
MKKTAMWLKIFLKSKTIIFSFVLTIFGFIQSQSDQIQILINDPAKFAGFCFVVSTIMFVLRFLTSTSLVEKSIDDVVATIEAVEKEAESDQVK